MKPIALVFLTAIITTGCSALSSRQISHYKDYGISDSLYAKMRMHRKLSESDIAELSQQQVQSSQIMTYLAFSNTGLSLNDDDVQRLWSEDVNGDVITYLRERPNRSGGLLTTFSPDFYSQVGMPSR